MLYNRSICEPNTALNVAFKMHYQENMFGNCSDNLLNQDIWVHFEAGSNKNQWIMNSLAWGYSNCRLDILHRYTKISAPNVFL